jgi:hypothetical protein
LNNNQNNSKDNINKSYKGKNDDNSLKILSVLEKQKSNKISANIIDSRKFSILDIQSSENTNDLKLFISNYIYFNIKYLIFIF